MQTINDATKHTRTIIHYHPLYRIAICVASIIFTLSLNICICGLIATQGVDDTNIDRQLESLPSNTPRWVDGNLQEWSQEDLHTEIASKPDIKRQKRLGAGGKPINRGASCAYMSPMAGLPTGLPQNGEPRAAVEYADLMDVSRFNLTQCNGALRAGPWNKTTQIPLNGKMSCFLDLLTDELTPKQMVSYMKPCCIHIYAILLHAVMTDLLEAFRNDPKVYVWAGSSSLLGMTRHSGIIPNDHDQDIVVMFEGKLDEQQRRNQVLDKVHSVLERIKETNNYVGSTFLGGYVACLISHTTSVKIDVAVGYYTNGFFMYPYADGVHMCNANYIMPLIACNMFGWPMPCPSQPGQHLKFFSPDDKPLNPAFKQSFQDKMLRSLKAAVGESPVCTTGNQLETRCTNPKYINKNDTQLMKLMMPCTMGASMGKSNLLLVSLAADVMDMSTEIIESTRCLRNTGWPSLITSCLAGVQNNTKYNVPGVNLCKRDKSMTYTPWEALYT